MLQMLREECSYFLGRKDQELEAKGLETTGITHIGKRYFISGLYRKSPRLWRFIYSDLMAEICRAALGEEAYLFNEQWVVKGAEVGMKFAWHQDSGYVKFKDPVTTHRPYLTCWTPLDDVDESNGTVYLLPHSRAGTRDRVLDHRKEEGSNDLIGYSGDDPGVAVIVPAGSVACFSSTSLHCSGANRRDAMRRVYLTQYSGEPLLRSDGSMWAETVPFVKGGKNVYDPGSDQREEARR
jgi:ectoine hydroxylase-related dioxygenase (phytanoyl-CoA dioxygenase family)